MVYYSLQRRQRRPPLRREQQYESMHQLIAERVRAMVRRHDHLDLALCVAQKRLENDALLAG